MATLNFNANNVEPAQSFEPLPDGKYLVAITDSQMKLTRACDGQYLNLQMEVLDGQYKGRMIFDRLNLQNPNPKAVEIAQRTLSAICHATGVINVQDSSQLHNIPMMAKVKVRPATPDYDASNDVKGYEPANNSTPKHVQAAQPAQAVAQTPQAAAVVQSAPWEQA